MNKSKLQCPIKSCKVNIMQTRLVTKYPPLSIANRYLDSKEKNRRTVPKPGLKMTNPKKLMVPKENHSNRMTQFVAVNPMEAQTNGLCRVSPASRNMSFSLDDCVRNDNNEKKHLVPSSKFGSTQNFTGAIRKIVISKKPKRHNKGLLIDKSKTKKEFSDFAPQPSAFVHILSAFISSSLESNFNCSCGSLGSLRTLSRMLEDVPEENDLIYESSFARPAISSSPKSISTYISPVEFSTDKSSLTIAHEIIVSEIITKSSTKSFEKSKGDTDLQSSQYPLSKQEVLELKESEHITCIEDTSRHEDKKATPSDVEIIVTRNPESNNNNEKNFQFPSETLNEPIKDNHLIDHNEADEKECIEKGPRNDSLCQELESIFRSKCIEIESREKCSISCPCFRDIEKYCNNFRNFYCCIPLNCEIDDEVDEINSRSETSQNDGLVSATKDGICEAANCSNTVQEPEKLAEKVLKQSGNIQKMPDHNIPSKLSASLPDLKKRQEHVETNKEYNGKKNIITLFLSENAKKMSKTVKNRIMKKLGRRKKKDSSEEMENFRNEVLEFFEATEKDDCRKETLEKLIPPSDKLVIPKFSQVFPDIERRTKEKINQILANSHLQHRPNCFTDYNVKDLILLYMK